MNNHNNKEIDDILAEFFKKYLTLSKNKDAKYHKTILTDFNKTFTELNKINPNFKMPKFDNNLELLESKWQYKNVCKIAYYYSNQYIRVYPTTALSNKYFKTSIPQDKHSLIISSLSMNIIEKQMKKLFNKEPLIEDILEAYYNQNKTFNYFLLDFEKK